MTAEQALQESTTALPPLVDGELVSFVDVRMAQKKTKAPTPYTEGSLIEDMKSAGKYVEDSELRKILKDTSGLGTSATRDSVIEVLKAHKYLEVKGKTIVSTEKGFAFIKWLDEYCPALTDIAKTAQWEAKLDVVAKNGGGAAFERGVFAQVQEIVDALKSAKPIPLKGSNMENQENQSSTKSGTPTQKQLEFAQKIAQRIGAELSDEELSSFAACSAFIEANKEAYMSSGGGGGGSGGPTAKQLEYAEKIAQRAGISLTKAQRESFAECSAFIEKHKDAGAPPPTDKQLAFAERISSSKSIPIPNSARKNMRELSKWIDANK